MYNYNTIELAWAWQYRIDYFAAWRPVCLGVDLCLQSHQSVVLLAEELYRGYDCIGCDDNKSKCHAEIKLVVCA